MLLAANVRVTTALEIAAKSASHKEFEDFFLTVRDHVTDGLSLSESFLMGIASCSVRMEEPWLLLSRWRAKLAGVNEMLDEIASDYEEELDLIAGQIDKIIEPIMLVVMGCIVGFLVYAIYGPIFNLSKVLLPKKTRRFYSSRIARIREVSHRDRLFEGAGDFLAAALGLLGAAAGPLSELTILAGV